MGRKKYMLEGVLKGRNELVQDSIYRDTGITRDRKQISSHLQVLKGHLKGIPVGKCSFRTSFPESRQRPSIGYFCWFSCPACVDKVPSSRIFLSSKVLEICRGGCAVAIRGVGGEGYARGCRNETNRAINSPCLHGYTRRTHEASSRQRNL